MTATKTTKATAATLTATQYRALKACSKKACTRKQISEAEFGGNSVNFAPILNPLVEAKLLKATDVDVDGKVETVFQATAAGSKLAAKAPPATARNGANHANLPKAGGTITKTYLGKEYKVTVTATGFKYAGKEYTSLTAVAKAIRKSDQEVNGWAFFGLVKAKAE